MPASAGQPGMSPSIAAAKRECREATAHRPCSAWRADRIWRAADTQPSGGGADEQVHNPAGASAGAAASLISPAWPPLHQAHL